MDVVSFETAKALKAAGFPVPDLCAGQMWHDGEAYYTIASISESKRHIAGMLFSEYTDECKELDFHVSLMDNDVFCPSATDILRELHEAKLEFHHKTNMWSCYTNLWYYDHENHAEVCALAWLELNKPAQDLPQ